MLSWIKFCDRLCQWPGGLSNLCHYCRTLLTSLYVQSRNYLLPILCSISQKNDRFSMAGANRSANLLNECSFSRSVILLTPSFGYFSQIRCTNVLVHFYTISC